VFILGIFGIAASQMGTGLAASAPSTNIGVIDSINAILVQHPDFKKAQETMQAEIQNAQKEFETKSANMNEQEKRDYFLQLQQRLEHKEQEVLGPVVESVKAAIADVAKAKGLAVVLEKKHVIYGGYDITADVIKKITK